MKNIMSLLALVFTLFLVNAATFTVHEHQQAIIIQLGKVRSEPVTRAGLHWKIPFIQDVKYFDKRILQWDGDRGEIPTKDKKFIWVDTTARWRIDNALRFYKTVRDISNASFRMGPIVDGATKDIISSHDLIEAVRNSNTIFEDIEKSKAQAVQNALDFEISDDASILDEYVSDLQKVRLGREKLSELIASRARDRLKEFGIALIDVQLRSIAYQESVEYKVFQSMVSERMQIATKIRSAGKGEEAKILGQLDLALKKVESEAYRKAEELKGTADAETINLYAVALKEDPQFYEFTKNLDAYKKTLTKNGDFILSTDNAFLSLFSKGR